MAKKAYVYNGNAWEDLASSVSDLSSYATTVDLDDYQLKSVAGLTFITSGTFTAANTASFATDTFSTTYENYRVIVNVTVASATQEMWIRLRAGTDSSANTYAFAFSLSSGVGNGLAQTKIRTGLHASTTDPCAFTFDVLSPRLSVDTTIVGTGHGLNSAGDTFNGGAFTGSFYITTPFDSMTILSSTGNFTGNYKVYGYGNS